MIRIYSEIIHANKHDKILIIGEYRRRTNRSLLCYSCIFSVDLNFFIMKILKN